MGPRLVESLLIWRDLLDWLWRAVLSVLCGYGERPERAIFWIATTFLGLGLVYFLASGFTDASLWECLYFSGASMTALGYGRWVSDPADWVRVLGLLQSFAGVFLISLFVATFVRKMSR